ncbi:CGNR zinc finger domain-containing protein [Actinocrispum sp. NPDC049592]|uniref:CGNR zinc finger domain-containing protein n=1 Tax=Actinocrispum sp. NPDC049592 TaxID=3154835 RepID=UPI0034198CCF
MQFNPYGGPAAELAAALVNVGKDVTDPAEAVSSLFRQYNRANTVVTDSEAVEILAWADRLSPAFGEPDLARLIDVVNGLLEDSASRPYISTHDGRAPHIHYSGEHVGEVARTKAFTAAGVAHVLCLDPARLGRCDGVGCEVVYVDTSRNGRRRFCSTRCATRVYVADHRSRVASGG